MYGYAFQFGTDNVDLKSYNQVFLQKLIAYRCITKLRENHIFTDGLIGISRIDLDLEKMKTQTFLKVKGKGNKYLVP